MFHKKKVTMINTDSNTVTVIKYRKLIPTPVKKETKLVYLVSWFNCDIGGFRMSS